MFIFAGHGCEDDELYMQDWNRVELVKDIVSPLLPGHCKELGNIPKVFLIDACRGTLPTKTTLSPRGSSAQKEATLDRGGRVMVMNLIPENGNFLLARSTLSEHKAYEDKQSGGLWLSHLAEVLTDLKEKMSMDDILSKVNENLLKRQQALRESFQQPIKESTLNRILYLEPCK